MERDDFGALDEGVRFEQVWNNEHYREARSLWVDEAWRETDLVCGRCPNRDAQDWQFRTTIQALLRNGPDWVLRVLAADPNRFFAEIDFIISPAELAPLREDRLATPSKLWSTISTLGRAADDFAAIDKRLAGAIRADRPRSNVEIELIRKTLAAAS